MYCEKQDLINGLSDRAVTAFAKDAADDTELIIDARIDAAITKACDVTDGYLRGKYALPLANVPGIVKSLAVDLALYFLASRKGIREGTPEENLRVKYEDAVRYLRDIQAGKADIGIPNDEGVSTPSTGATVSAPAKIFDDTFWNGW